VRSPTERPAPLAALILLAAACTAAPTPSPTPARSDAPASASPVASGSPGGLALADPGRPYDGPAILEAMRTSPRPDGVPAEVQTDEIAAAIADAIWTFDGEAWQTLSVEGACAATCTVEIAGSRGVEAGEDLWSFLVDPGTERVTVDFTNLRALPDELVAALDGLARRISSDGALDELRITSAAWTPPPDADRYVLSYRSGGEEGSCAAEIVVDARRGALIDETYSGC
jgi:hypothetical protein